MVYERIRALENGFGHLPPSSVDFHPFARGHCDRRWTRCAGQGGKNRSDHGKNGRQGSAARMGWELDQARGGGKLSGFGRNLSANELNFFIIIQKEYFLFRDSEILAKIQE